MNFYNLAASVLPEYGLEDSSITFLRHNENAVFKVEHPSGKTFVLRLHVPVSGLSGDALMHERKWIEGELEFINALYENSDIIVQRPVPTKKGSLLAEIPGGYGSASILSWPQGNTFDQSADTAKDDAGSVGELAARMHEFVVSWPESRNLARPLYDSRRIKDAIHKIKGGVALELFSDYIYRELADGADQICIEFDRENHCLNSHGLIHSDLGLGNIIVNGGTVSPIDFGLCGHGPFLFDMGGLMGAFDIPVLRRAVMDGYSRIRPISGENFRAIEAFFLSSVYFFMALHLRNTPMREWFGRRLPSFVHNYVRPFNNGVPFLHKLID